MKTFLLCILAGLLIGLIPLLALMTFGAPGFGS